MSQEPTHEPESAVKRWLSPPDPSKNHNRAVALRHPSSGDWFLRGEAYQHWKTNSQTFLRLNGKPGSGKTVLTSTVIEDLKIENPKTENQDSSALLYFYFSFSDNTQQKFEHMLRSLVWQLYDTQLSTRFLLESLYQENDNGQRQPEIGSICSVFKDMLGETSEAWIVLDALDESEGLQTRSKQPRSNWDLFRWIKQLQDVKKPLHLFMTGRQERHIESRLRDSVRDSITDYKEVSLDNHGSVDEDIRDYIEDTVKAKLDRWSDCPDLQQEIKNKLTHKRNRV